MSSNWKASAELNSSKDKSPSPSASLSLITLFKKSSSITTTRHKRSRYSFMSRYPSSNTFSSINSPTSSDVLFLKWKRLEAQSLLDNAPNYVVGYIIQKGCIFTPVSFSRIWNFQFPSFVFVIFDQSGRLVDMRFTTISQSIIAWSCIVKFKFSILFTIVMPTFHSTKEPVHNLFILAIHTIQIKTISIWIFPFSFYTSLCSSIPGVYMKMFVICGLIRCK